MGKEITEDTQSAYVPIEERPERELKRLAEKMGLDVSPSLGRDKLVHAVKVELFVRQQKVEEEARTKMQAERMIKLGMQPGQTRKPSFEEVSIRNSKKVLVRFDNKENPGDGETAGADIEFDKGKIHFHLFDGFVHVLPECIVSDDEQFKHISLTQKCTYPVYAKKSDPRTGFTYSAKVGTRQRFILSILGDAPKDHPFGVYQEEYKTKKQKTA